MLLPTTTVQLPTYTTAANTTEDRMSNITPDAIRIKRAYAAPSATDGTRVLIDRLWPRGIKKSDAAIDEWIKELSPSTELRKWFGHDPARWEEFRRRFTKELREQDDQIERLRTMARHGTLTLVYSARDEQHNDAVVLREILLKH